MSVLSRSGFYVLGGLCVFNRSGLSECRRLGLSEFVESSRTE